jgi:hypothetical protein
MRDVAIIGFAQQKSCREHTEGNDIEILIDPIREALEQAGLTRAEIDFTTGGSNDFLVGQAFSFVRALDAVGVHPAKEDSHVEMDGAWALYEAWVRLQLGDIDTALIWALGKAAMGNIAELMTLSMDPYYVSPLGLDPTSVAGMQARAMIDAGLCDERDLAEIAAARQAAAMDNVRVEWDRARSAAEILAEPYRAMPLRASMVPPVTDGAAAMVIAAGDAARRLCERPAWIRGIDHRTDAHGLGVRTPTECSSARLAAERAGLADAPVEVAELHAAYPHEEILLRSALGLGDETSVNPSGGALVADPVMATGLIRIGEAARHIHEGRAKRTAAHATAGPWLQSNLVVVMEASS